MDETSTPKLIKFNSTEKMICVPRYGGINKYDPFEKRLASLLDKELINPRKQVIDNILEFSKRNT